MDSRRHWLLGLLGAVLVTGMAVTAVGAAWSSRIGDDDRGPRLCMMVGGVVMLLGIVGVTLVGGVG